MKVLTVNYSDLDGGAARAAYRLHEGLQRIGVGSELLVRSKSSDDRLVHGPQGNWEKAQAILRPVLDQRATRGYSSKASLFSPAKIRFSGMVDRINAFDADVVHLHWITGGMMRVEDLAGIRRPMVWSLHDMWPFTGGCHYDGECGRFTAQCGSCPVLHSDQENDLSRSVFRRKARTYAATKNLTIIGLSRWMADTAASSTLFKDKRVVHLPNGIDTTRFKPLDKRWAKEALGLPTNKPLVLFGAVNATGDKRKGFDHLQAALKQLPPGSVELAVFGASRPPKEPDLGHPSHYLGRLQDDATLCLLYNAADVTVVPSTQENLSNTIVESLACGTPAVAFAIGGNSDMIDHHGNGALAKPFDAADLAAGIRWVVEHPDPKALSAAARRTALERFELVRVAERYRALYEEVVRTAR